MPVDRMTLEMEMRETPESAKVREEVEEFPVKTSTSLIQLGNDGKAVFTSLGNDGREYQIQIDGLIASYKELNTEIAKTIPYTIYSFTPPTIYSLPGVGGELSAHYSGLDYVPYDNYGANLHKGEAVLNRDEADMYRKGGNTTTCLLYTSPSPRDRQKSRMPSSA